MFFISPCLFFFFKILDIQLNYILLLKRNKMQTFIGKIINISEIESGTSSTGKSWKKINFLVEEMNVQYPQKAAFVVFGDQKVNEFSTQNKVDDIVKVHYNINSREFNGKFYTNLDSWKIEKNTNQPINSTKSNQISLISESQDDMPF
jgi:Domain of unknown function (DUF3127)